MADDYFVLCSLGMLKKTVTTTNVTNSKCHGIFFAT